MKPLRTKILRRSRSAPLLLTFFLTTVICFPQARAGNTILNGAAPRPFYVFAHNPNSTTEIDNALNNGCNALEPDITTASCGGQEILVDWDSDFPNRDGKCTDLHLADWCEYVHAKALLPNSKLSLIVFDTKTPAASAARGPEILDTIRQHLNYGGVNINVIISVATRSDGALFDNILTQLGEREAAQVDAENDAADILNFFFARNFSGNIGYGDGTATQGPNLPRAMDKAAFLRASIGYPRIVTYVYTLSEEDSEHSFIDGGTDGIIPTDGSQLEVLGVVASHPEIRLGVPSDNPFQPLNEAYGLEFQTSNDNNSGTDADFIFTLTGCRGSATIRVNAGYIIPLLYDSHRFEDGRFDWVTIPSANLGELQSITIQNLGGGNAPGWKPVDVKVSSARWLGPDSSNSREYHVTIDQAIDSGETKNFALTRNFQLLPSIKCPADITVPNDPNQCGAVVTFTPVVDAPCNNGISISSPASGALFPVGSTVVSSYAQSPEGQSVPCTFTVTVQDKQNPIVNCPASKVVNATSPAGTVVAFAPTASDNCSVASLVSVPASGSTFPIGDSSVTCTAKDGAGNVASCNFNIHVKGAQEQANDLIGVIGGLPIKSKLKQSLTTELNELLSELAQSTTPCDELSKFIEAAQKAQKTKKITPAQATQLINAASLIQAVVGC